VSNGAAEAPLRVAVVGSGPAGFYATGALLDADIPVEVDMLERLPTPWGLVRMGVAPDHPKLKTVSVAFERIADRPGFRFLGNVEIGRDLHHSDLARLYDAVVYAVGAQTDRRLGIAGEDLPGVWGALEFVAWYNGHPDYQGLPFDLDVERAVVIGNGNVALDVARMLGLTQEELAPTDTTDRAIEAIASSGLEEIVILGRRGPAEAAFKPPELGELGEMAGADVTVDPVELELDPVSLPRVEADTRVQRILEILADFAGRAPTGKPRTLRLRFLASPVAIHGTDRVEAVEIVRNRLESRDGRVVAAATGERETIPCGLVFRSVGYRGVAIPDVPFDEARGTIRNDCGRVLEANGQVAPGLYCAGWIKRGPTGIIGTNKKDAVESVGLLLADVRSGRIAHDPDATAEAVDALLDERGVRRVVYAGWQAIDRHERGLGEPLGRPRVKLVTWDELLESAEAIAAET
jgi:ferredoxin--NADP+ reductase